MSLREWVKQHQKQLVFIAVAILFLYSVISLMIFFSPIQNTTTNPTDSNHTESVGSDIKVDIDHNNFVVEKPKAEIKRLSSEEFKTIDKDFNIIDGVAHVYITEPYGSMTFEIHEIIYHDNKQSAEVILEDTTKSIVNTCDIAHYDVSFRIDEHLSNPVKDIKIARLSN